MKKAMQVPASSAPERLRALTLAALLLAAGSSMAAGVAEVTHLAGTLSASGASGTPRLLDVRSEVREGETLATEADTYARLRFVDGAEVVLRPNTRMKVETYAFAEARPESDNVFLRLLKGGMRAVTGLVGKRNRERVGYGTPTATIGIRGSNIGMLSCNGDCQDVQTPTGTPPPDGVHVDVASGAAIVFNPAGQQLVGAGQFAYVATINTPPVLTPAGYPVTMPQAIARNRGDGRGIGAGNGSDCRSP